jgi:FtsH-binding integral membrane protein
MNEVDRDHLHPTVANTADPAVDLKLRAFMVGVYNKVALGLLLSAALAYMTSAVPAIRDTLFITVTTHGARHLGGLTALGMIGACSPLLALAAFGMGAEQTPARSGLLYWIVVASVGASFGVLVLVYTTVSIAAAFLASAAGFGALSLFGYATQRDLAAHTSFLVTGLIGLIVASGLNLLLHSSAIGFVIDTIGVLIFAGLIAHDTQRLKMFYHQCEDDQTKLKTATNVGALSLYLDFINFFQFLLAFMGGRR